MVQVSAASRWSAFLHPQLHQRLAISCDALQCLTAKLTTTPSCENCSKHKGSGSEAELWRCCRIAFWNPPASLAESETCPCTRLVIVAFTCCSLTISLKVSTREQLAKHTSLKPRLSCLEETLVYRSEDPSEVRSQLSKVQRTWQHKPWHR